MHMHSRWRCIYIVCTHSVDESSIILRPIPSPGVPARHAHPENQGQADFGSDNYGVDLSGVLFLKKKIRSLVSCLCHKYPDLETRFHLTKTPTNVETITEIGSVFHISGTLQNTL